MFPGVLRLARKDGCAPSFGDSASDGHVKDLFEPDGLLLLTISLPSFNAFIAFDAHHNIFCQYGLGGCAQSLYILQLQGASSILNTSPLLLVCLHSQGGSPKISLLGSSSGISKCAA